MSHPISDKGQGKDVFKRRLPWGRGYGGDTILWPLKIAGCYPRKLTDLNLYDESSLNDWDSSSFLNNLFPLKALDYIGIFGYNKIVELVY